MSKHAQHGFTLIEAIVAMVLVASMGMALFGWINSNIITLNRVQDANAQSAATANALDFMSTVNPMVAPTGEARLGAYQLRWQSTPSTEPRDGAGYPYGISQFQLAMYDTRVQVATLNNQPWFDFSVQQVGYKQVRSMKMEP